MDNILKPFIQNPEKEFHVRQIAKLVKKSPTTISKHLKNLEKEKILKSERKFNHLFFKANTECIKFKQLKLDYNLISFQNCGVIEYLISEFNHPEAIILFGSFSKAEDIPSSDIDLLIISSLKKEVKLDKFEKILGHKIQILVKSKTDIEKMKGKNKELLNKLVNGIVISGFWEIFK